VFQGAIDDAVAIQKNDADGFERLRFRHGLFQCVDYFEAWPERMRGAWYVKYWRTDTMEAFEGAFVPMVYS
jgi:hypothetical protein